MQLVVHSAITHSADALGIAVDEDDPLAALPAIQAKSPAIFQALDNLLNGLAAWYQMHQDIAAPTPADGSPDSLNTQQVKEFIKRIDGADR
jgi:hypothetical protein